MNEPASPHDVDPATVEVVRNYLTSATGEMHRTLVRTAYNSIIYEILDFGITLYDKEMNLIADSPGLTIFLGANDYGLRKAVEHVGKENLEEGDVLMLNYPYWSSGHTADALVFAPIFYQDELIGYSAIRAHWIDIGAKDEGYILDSTDLHQEGLVMPGVKLYKGGEPDEEMLNILRFNSRMPRDTIGNLNAQVASLRIGEKRLKELHEKYGSDTIEACIDEILSHGEEQSRQALQELPDGTWSAEGYLDDDGVNRGEPVKMATEVTINCDEFFVDFSDSSDEVEGPLNVPIGLTETTAKVALKTLTTPNEPSNGGHYEPVDIHAPEGNLFHATYPAPTFTLWPALLGIEIVLKAVAKGMPEKLPASSGNEINGLAIYGEDPETGRMYQQHNDEGVGWGATTAHDGANALMHISEAMVQNIPTEVFEQKAPVRIERYQLRQDSGGPGEQRGGLGARRDYYLTRDANALSVSKNTKSDNWGLEGGKPGARNVTVWYPNTDEETRIPTYRDSLDEGDRISVRGGGGGGHGSPFKRDPERVREDVLNGYVSRKSALDDYGVVLTDDLQINHEETNRRRSGER